MTTTATASQRRALVTGSTGFVGRHLAAALVRDGWHVHAVIRPESDPSPLAALGSQVTLHRHDGTTAGLCSIAAAALPHVAFHLASRFKSDHEPDDVGPLVDSNVRFPAQLLEALSRARVRCLVNTGTAWQHFEDRIDVPANLYAATKQALESILAYYIDAHGLEAVTLELYDTYGPGDPRSKILSLLRRASLEGTPLSMSPGEQRVDLVHVSDVVAAFLLAAEHLLGGRCTGHERYAISSGQPLPLKELVARYERVLGRRIPVRWGGRPYREREVMVPWSRGAPVPGWRPRISLDEGLRSLDDPAPPR